MAFAPFPALGWAKACWIALFVGLTPLPAVADTLRLCDGTDHTTAADKDRLLQVSAVARSLLNASSRELALVSRAGLSLERFGQRYSHMGFALRSPVHPDDAPWAVRQLYHDCEAGRSRIYDQGLAAFVVGAGRAEVGFVSLLWLPAEADAALAGAVRRNTRALSVLEHRYSANSHAWATLTQNCNQWVAEMLALAWRDTAADEEPGLAEIDGNTAVAAHRLRAQDWLSRQGYEPTVFALSPLWMIASHVMPWLSAADHPAEDLQALRYRVSMPQSIEAFVMRRWPATQRAELCHDRQRVVVRRGTEPLTAANGQCLAAAGDEVIALQ